MGIRQTIRVLHRDVGYLLTVLVALYAISGIAVNHVDDWNPSYATSTVDVAVGPVPDAAPAALEAEIVRRLALDPSEVQGRHRSGTDEFTVFLPHGGAAKVRLSTGAGTVERRTPRAGLFQANVLHLNHLKGVWTIVADVFSLLLLGLAVTGLFMLPGPKGLAGRGKWFVAAGALVPVAFLVHYWWRTSQ